MVDSDCKKRECRSATGLAPEAHTSNSCCIWDSVDDECQGKWESPVTPPAAMYWFDQPKRREMSTSIPMLPWHLFALPLRLCRLEPLWNRSPSMGKEDGDKHHDGRRRAMQASLMSDDRFDPHAR